jgi:methylthioribose-1-phosphate isomerase
MQHGKVDLVLVGADRVTRRGDVANKIGTYLKALAARDNGVPFYVAVPTPTIDWTLADGLASTPIEERSADEVRMVRGLDAAGRPASFAIATASTAVANPAFDVTPAGLVTGIVTEKGIFAATEDALAALAPRERAGRAVTP